MSKTARSLLQLFLCVLLIASLAISAYAVEDGWSQNADGSWSYYQNGEMLVDQEFYVDGYTYRVDENGIMLASKWYLDENTQIYYYYGSNGIRYENGAYQIGSSWYMFDYDGWMLTNTTWSFYNEETGRNCYYRAKEDGKLYVNEWYQDGEYWYYYGADAAEVHGCAYKIGGAWYLFDSSGLWVTESGTYSFYDYSLGRSVYYRIKDNGTLYVNEWYQEGEDRYYYGPDGGTCYGPTQVGGYYYFFFYDGRMMVDSYTDIYDDEQDRWVYYRAKEDGTLYVNEWYTPDEWNTYYYGEGGAAPYGPYEVDGQLYLFYGDGYLAKNARMTWNGVIYVSDENGYATALKEGWNQVGEDWYYVKDGVLYTGGVYQIGSKYYIFEYNGRMATDVTYGYWNDELGRYVYYHAKEDGTLCVNEWYYDEWNTYYYGEGGAAPYGPYEVDGQLYLFHEDGRLSRNYAMTWNETYYVSDENGYAYAITEGWTQVGEYWYYAKDGVMYSGGVYQIGSYYYMFDYSGRMATNVTRDYWNDELGRWVYYHAKENGTLCVNEWYNGCYYGEGGMAAYGPTTVDGKTYFFSEDGRPQTNCAFEYDGVIYAADSEGNTVVLKNNQWTQVGEYWYYVKDNVLCTYGVYKIGGYFYMFNGNGQMWKNATLSVWDDTLQREVYYRSKSDGTLYVNEWYINGSSRYYYGEDGKSAYGPLTVNGQLYVFRYNGRAITNSATSWEGKHYASDNAGKAVELANNTWTQVGSWWYYVQDNALCVNGVYLINGKYYMFDSDGWMLTNTTMSVPDSELGREIFYRSKDSGVLYVNEWYNDGYGNYWYYGEGGKSAYGITTVSGQQYIFGYEGNMYANTVANWDGVYYTVDANGRIAVMAKDKWVQVGGYWYYIQDDNLCSGGLYKIGSKSYLFDGSGRMMTEGTIWAYNAELGYYGYHRAKADGTPYVNEWYQDNYGNWYYYGAGGVAANGMTTVNGQQYYFEAGCMVTNNVIVWEGVPYAADNAGKLTKMANNAWTQIGSDWYYVQDNQLCTDGIYKIGSKYYMFSNSRLAYNSEMSTWDETLQREVYYRSKADGTLYVNEWYFTKDYYWYYGEAGVSAEGFTTIGGKHYAFYYDGRVMRNQAYRHDGVNYAADDQGLLHTLANGWNHVGNYWYYVENNAYYCNGVTKIAGKYYFFYSYGCMADDAFVSAWDETQGRSIYYYADKGGVLVENGWKDGHYFGEGGVAAYGPTTVDGQLYVFWEGGYAMRNTSTNWNGVNYAADNQGHAVILKNNQWTQVGNYWYYVQNEQICKEGIYKIGSNYYMFDWDGWMLTNRTWDMWDDALGRSIYYRSKADGTLYVNEWYGNGSSRYYYGEGGKSAYGLVKVDGVLYVFRYNGRISRNTGSTWDGVAYATDNSGVATKLPNNQWTKVGNYTYYVQDSVLCQSGVYLIGGKYYMFDSDGWMLTDTTSGYWNDALGRYVYYHAKENGTLYVNEWYQDRNGTYWYYGNGGVAVQGVVKVGGQPYIFSEDGMMLTYRAFTWEGKHYVTNAEGKNVQLTNNNWTQVGDYWFYVQNNVVCVSQVCKIGTSYYAFNASGRMVVDGTLSLYDDKLGREVYYRAKASGVLCVNEWYQDDYGIWYYYGAAGASAYGVVTVSGQKYAFYVDGSMCTNSAYYWQGTQYATDTAGKLIALPADQWKQVGDYWYYLSSSEGLCSGGAYKIGTKYYLFDYSGHMLVNGTWRAYNPETDTDNLLYHSKADGTLYVNEWYKDSNGKYYYHGEDGAAVSGVAKIDGVVYYFNYETCEMYKDFTMPYAGEWYAAVDNGVGVKLSSGWNKVGGYWYYVKNGEPLWGVQKIDGKYYMFVDHNRMVTDASYSFYNEELGREIYYHAKANGVLYVNEWYKSEYGVWFYYGEGGESAYGLVKLGNTYYGFGSDGRMLTDRGYMGYILDENGVGTKMKDNAWTSYNGNFYYVQNGEMCADGVYKIDGKLYAFDSTGIMFTDSRFSIYNEQTGRTEYYCAKTNGALYVNEWYQDPYGQWYYYGENGCAARNLATVNGVLYAFTSFGRLCENEIVQLTDVWYSTDAAGKVILKAGWYKVDGSWVYVEDSTGALRTGWFEYANGKRVYLAPRMYHNTIVTYDGKLYVVDAQGFFTEYTGTDLYGSMYVENAKIVYKQWRTINGSKYYFGEDGYYFTGFCRINNKAYLFREDGKLLTGGWVMSSDGSWGYADTNGVLKTGFQTIGSANYYFDNYGMLYTNTYLMYKNVYYYADETGVLTKSEPTATEFKEGWNSIDGVWYYMQNGELISGQAFEINGKWYYFDYTGAMVTNAQVGYRYYGANGAAVSGWIKDGKRWMYADPETCVLVEGLVTIGGVDYFFSGYRTLSGTFVYDMNILIVDSNGVVKSNLPIADGWSYANGYVIYMKDGELYTGWVGNYLIIGGVMVRGEYYEYEGKYYYLDAYGVCAKPGWLQLGEYAYMYVRADGSLYYNEWLKLGGKYYYFDGAYMATGHVTIDGVMNRFDSNGVWLGTVAAIDSGWKQVDGVWYYYHAGKPVEEGTYYIDGKWYYMWWDGSMATEIIENGYYYGTNGVRAEYTGWKQIEKRWYFFSESHQLVYGWFVDGGNTYYQGNSGVLTGKVMMGGQVHEFSASGVYKGKVEVKDGWYQLNGEWYYFNGGYVLTGYQTIDGASYYFFEDGIMTVDNIVYYNGMYRYFDANGREVTKQGWTKLAGEYDIYIDANGRALFYGVHVIDGKVYYFTINLYGAGG